MKAILDNPVFSRQVAVTLSGTKFALVFLFANAVLIISTLLAIAAGIDDSAFREIVEKAGLGLLLQIVNSCAIYGLLAVLLPLQVARLFEAQRLDRVFDQLVVTGARPGRLHFGNWTSVMAYAAAILVSTLPYAAFAHAVKGATVSEILENYAILFAYANVIALVTMAMSVAMTEFLAAPLSIFLFLSLGLLALTPIPTVLISWTPVRWFMNMWFKPIYASFSSASLSTDQVLFSLKIPDSVMAVALWGLLAALALVYLALGPSHKFSPGLNNFGNVVLRGDRKRSRLRTLRLQLNRRVEMAFLYENRPRFWGPWDWSLRSMAILASVLLFWTISIGWIFNASIGGSATYRDEIQIYILVVGGLGLAFGLLAYGESRDRIRDLERVGPFRVRRGVLALSFFAVLLAGYGAFTYFPIAEPMRSFIQKLASSTEEPAGEKEAQIAMLQASLDSVPGRIGVLAAFAANLFLLSRLIARTSLAAAAGRSKLLMAILILLFAPMVTLPLFEEKVIQSRTLARAAFFSPITALVESYDPRDRTFGPRGIGSGKDLYWMLQGGFAAALLLAILALNARARRKARRLATGALQAKALAAGAALAIALALGSSRAAEEISAEVVRGFNGHGFSRDLDHFTAILSRPEPPAGGDRSAGSAECWLEAPDGEPLTPVRRVEVPPGTRIPVRFGPEALAGQYFGSGVPVRLEVRLGGARRSVEIPPLSIEPEEKVRFLAIGESGKVPSLLPASQSWVGTRPEWLPERPESFGGSDFVLVGPTDLGSWTAPQRRALYDFLRSGGTVVFHGAIDERSLGSSPEWAELLSSAGPPRTEVRDIPFRIHPLRGARTVWADGEGSGALPVLQLRSFGPGFVGHLSVDPLNSATAERFGGPERFWKRFTDLVPSGLCVGLPMIASIGYWRGQAGGKSLTAVAAYFAAYAIVLGPAMLILFRSRRRRLWVWIYAPAVSAAFVLASPWAFRWILSEPSIALEASVTFFGEGGEGIRHTETMISSSGRQDHRLAFPLPDVTAFECPGGRISLFGGFAGQISQLGTSTGEGPLKVPELSVAPWGSRRVYSISRDARPPPAEVRGRVRAQKQKGQAQIGSWLCEVEGLRPGRQAWIVIYPIDDPASLGSTGPNFRQVFPTNRISESIAGWIHPAGPAKGTLSANSRDSLPFDIQVNRRLRPRAFVVWKEDGCPAAVESEELVFPEGGRFAFSLKEIDVVIPEEKSDKK